MTQGLFTQWLYPVASGWPPCISVIITTALLVKDADKLTPGQPLTTTTPYSIERVLQNPPDWWMTNAQLTHYLALLLNPLTLTSSQALLSIQQPCSLTQIQISSTTAQRYYIKYMESDWSWLTSLGHTRTSHTPWRAAVAALTETILLSGM